MLTHHVKRNIPKFLRQSLLIFIMKGFRTIVFIFIVISTTFQPITIKMKTIVQKPLMIKIFLILTVKIGKFFNLIFINCISLTLSWLPHDCQLCRFFCKSKKKLMLLSDESSFLACFLFFFFFFLLPPKNP